MPFLPARRTRVLPAVVALLVLALAGCGLSSPAGSAKDERPSGAAAPDLADVKPLADPRAWTGASSAVVGDTEVDPVADPTPELPVTVTDNQGTKVTVRDASRILALDVYGTLARTVFELGLGKNVVGRDTTTRFAEADDLPLVTQNGHDLSAESILELDPTVILTDTSLGPWDVILQMREIGIPVVVLDSRRGLRNVDALITDVAQALGVPKAGKALAKRTADEVEKVRAVLERVAPDKVSDQLRAVFLYVRGQAGVYYMFGADSGAEGLIDALGLYDVAEEIDWNGMKPVTDEAIIAAQPDVVLMMTGGLDSAGGVKGLLERLPALANTPAGERERFVDMEDSQILGFGPLTADVLNALGVAVYAPDALS
ncbi:ABC transporter substrate-binding protein [Nocardioides sp. zg-536]|uniref:ABC transporter substrate-binding protein n=1 Tax=Nocardioides faecalis TaxID=2803858 RepID=A0A939BS93_9ACTN|nr:ABC transporter substrate-binding protein [Nocardioides faecalis]MBM9459399.1 ABC transporter substrate-binding protein [Nocardioides faecalis]QVI59492.1 ABC transporter substrate-binding protein [Nocardioides faecalis]